MIAIIIFNSISENNESRILNSDSSQSESELIRSQSESELVTKIKEIFNKNERKSNGSRKKFENLADRVEDRYFCMKNFPKY